MFNNTSLKYIKPKNLSLNYSKIHPKDDDVIIEVDKALEEIKNKVAEYEKNPPFDKSNLYMR